MAKRLRRSVAITPTERGLLAAVADAPDDALTRLVYADWLEAEAGTDGPRRGEYLRAWCDMLPVSVRDLDAYAEAAEALESLAAGLNGDWLAAVQSWRFHLVDPVDVAARAEAFFLRYGGAARLIDARLMTVLSTGGDWEVRYTTAARGRTAARVARHLAVVRATGRVHMMTPSGRRTGTHHPNTIAPSETDGRNS